MHPRRLFKTLPGQTRFSGRVRLLLAWLLAGAWVPATWAQENPYDQVQRLLNAGQTTEAMQSAEGWLAQRPRDPQMRLLQGVILNRQGQANAALGVFTDLTREHPELPEPHNNLAVMHAQAGRLEAARVALETALRLNRDYATAHRNLGDVYLRLAAQSYQQAQQRAPADPVLADRLQAIDRWTAPPQPQPPR